MSHGAAGGDREGARQSSRRRHRRADATHSDLHCTMPDTATRLFRTLHVGSRVGGESLVRRKRALFHALRDGRDPAEIQQRRGGNWEFTERKVRSSKPPCSLWRGINQAREQQAQTQRALGVRHVTRTGRQREQTRRVGQVKEGAHPAKGAEAAGLAGCPCPDTRILRGHKQQSLGVFSLAQEATDLSQSALFSPVNTGFPPVRDANAALRFFSAHLSHL